ncbi:MAG: hypothetical protein NZ853_05435 [Leptospiraceae bacterium]|nr:hypothetical protein [Leptospiraceae bacterium]MDW7976609.1 hypothetical protein [Leptospiraceae bacterium]
MMPSLLCEAKLNDKKFFIQFGGQGNSFLKEMQILYEREDLKEFFYVAFEAIDYCMNHDQLKDEVEIYFPERFPLKSWLEKHKKPKDEYLSICPITFPGNQITQLANLYAFIKNGFDPDEFLPHVLAATGHSGGLQAAVIFALGKKGKDLLEIIFDFIVWYTMAGYYSQKAYGFQKVSNELKEWSLKVDRDIPYPMAVVSNITFNELENYIEEFHRKYPEVLEFPIKISLINAKTIFVITGHAKDLVLFRKSYLDEFHRKHIQWSYVPVSIPFHRWDTMKEKIYDFYNDEVCKKIKITGKDLKVPVISFTDDGVNLQEIENLSVYLADAMMNQILYWDKAVAPVLNKEKPVDYIIDFGPGKITSILTKYHLEEHQITHTKIYSCVGRSGLNQVLKKIETPCV